MSALEEKFGQYTSIHKDVARIYGGTEDGSYAQAPKENTPITIREHALGIKTL